MKKWKLYEIWDMRYEIWDMRYEISNYKGKKWKLYEIWDMRYQIIKEKMFYKTTGWGDF